MADDLFKDLNPEQQKAVLSPKGPMIILAGAGSGKTRVITYRVINLLLKGVSPQNILCVTFTNKAAHEMKERILTFANISGNTFSTNDSPTISTFHSLCAKVLRHEAIHIKLSPSFVIYDTSDQLDLIKQIFKTLQISTKDYKPGSILATISEAKNELIVSKDYPKYARGHFQETAAKVYVLYEKMLKENEALDFDDLLLKTVELFTENKEILNKYQDIFQYILVDEYQDTNHAQYALTKMLALKHKNICVVGDFSQSIYSWRGADFRNLQKFKDDFENTKVFSLSQNYRSTKVILDAASSVISNNTTHPVLSLWTDNPKGEDITIYEAGNERDEARFILDRINELILSQPDFKLSDAAVLYRINSQSRVVEETFLREGIAYVLVGGIRFYERKEIKDLVSYLRILANPKDNVSYRRIEKLGKARLAKFENLIKKLESQDLNPLKTNDILSMVLATTDYLSFFDEKDEEDRQRLENIKELRSVAVEFEHLTNFLENISLVEQEYPSALLKANMQNEKGINGNKNAVTLMTIHAAKGLEFKAVFMCGMEEGLFPHSRSLMDKNELEEERRLCYVGMTRAREKLFLSYARERLFFGQRNSNVVSRFIFELPKDCLTANFGKAQSNKNNAEFL